MSQRSIYLNHFTLMVWALLYAALVYDKASDDWGYIIVAGCAVITFILQVAAIGTMLLSRR